ncbi:MAG: nucleotidyltransferase domain-containing protein [Acidobacteriota bacterium]|nr:nucleotidyltransferase domain-containing protein [Acidobacteriota bacterium]
MAEVAKRVVTEEGGAREHFVVCLSGAHAYGFPSPDSGLDLEAVHIAPTVSWLGLRLPPPRYDRDSTLEGVEIDYTSNEIGQVLEGVLKGNGSFLERLMGESLLFARPELLALWPLLKHSLSRRFHRHYRSLAQRRLRELEQEPTVKRLLDVLRTALTGTHLLRTGEVVADVTALLGEYGLGRANELVERKLAGERVELGSGELARWKVPLADLLAGLEVAAATSVLPDEPPNEDEIDGWLRSFRLTLLEPT